MVLNNWLELFNFYILEANRTSTPEHLLAIALPPLCLGRHFQKFPDH